MKTKLVYVGDTQLLNQIQKCLKSKKQFIENLMFDEYFQTLLQLKNNKQPLFAIGFHFNQPDKINLIYSTHTEYKLTRNLCTCAHIQEIYKDLDVSKQEIEQFYTDLISQLNCYKVVALNIEENSVLKPNQMFMMLQNKANL